MQFLGEKWGYFQKVSLGSKTLDVTLEGLGEMFEGEIFPAVDGNLSGPIKRAHIGSKDPIGASLTNLIIFVL